MYVFLLVVGGSVNSGNSGDQTTHSVGEVNFYMRFAPSSTFPIGTDDDGKSTVQ